VLGQPVAGRERKLLALFSFANPKVQARKALRPFSLIYRLINNSDPHVIFDFLVGVIHHLLTGFNATEYLRSKAVSLPKVYLATFRTTTVNHENSPSILNEIECFWEPVTL